VTNVTRTNCPQGLSITRFNHCPEDYVCALNTLGSYPTWKLE